MATMYDQDWSAALDGVDGFNSTVSNTDGDMTWVNGVSPLDGSTGYVSVVCDDTTANFGLISFDLLNGGQTNFRHNHMMDFNTFAIATDGQSVKLFNWQNNDNTNSLGAIYAVKLAGALNIRLQAVTDAGGTTDADHVLSGTPEWFELDIQRATGASANDGVYRLWLGGGDYPSGGQLVATISGIDNHTDFPLLQYIRLGATNIAATASGTFYLDHARGNDAGTDILVVTNSAPTVSDPGTLYAGHEALAVGTLVTVADTDSNLEFIQYTCESGKGTWNGTLGSSTVSAGALASNTVTITGTNAALLATHATMTLTPASSAASIVTNACTITATDDAVASDAQNFNVVQSYGVVTGTHAQIQATLAGVLVVSNAVEEICTLGVTAIDDSAGTSSDTCAITFATSGVQPVGAVLSTSVRRRRRS